MTVRVKGLDEFRAELKRVDRRFGKAFGKANRAISKKVVDKAKPAVRGLRSPGGTVAIPGIKPSSKEKAAVIRLDNASAPTLFANIFGTLSHQVFGRNIPGSGPFLPWVGQSWDPEDLHGVGPALRSAADGFILEDYLDAVMEALTPAFPD